MYAILEKPCLTCICLHSERNSTQANLISETIARFLLDKHGDLYFLLQNNSVHILSSLT